jgi:hypothetical protein
MGQGSIHAAIIARIEQTLPGIDPHRVNARQLMQVTDPSLTGQAGEESGSNGRAG